MDCLGRKHIALANRLSRTKNIRIPFLLVGSIRHMYAYIVHGPDTPNIKQMVVIFIVNISFMCYKCHAKDTDTGLCVSLLAGPGESVLH